MITTPTPDRSVRGVIYNHGQAKPVVGFPIRRGVATDTVTFVDLLTTDGVLVHNAQVAPAALTGVQVAPLRSAATDDFLWRLAEKNIGGWGDRCLAELAYREAEANTRREVARRVARLRRAPAADLLASLHSETAKAGA